ncbi:hypothetical protein N7447_005909 [Penicillium robsamsonii]|uniref:uncharacterized protein n=1 Tax=Penicillium robsamsonii TaxID=1792511 RepID=UPI002549049B|nr:uncharacterized protein N7447_005909 [Penicillium robsamsonii]KAJ5823569.1 hypothetical protein N7447_005909 [Penicillium robsamsonii]
MTRMHYASRTMEGVEMAMIAARDLVWIPSQTRQLTWILTFNRDEDSLEETCDAASRDPTVKIDLLGRKLTDEGFEIFIDALLETLQKERDDKHPEGFVRLFELQLSGNCLTLKSLPKLGRAIRLSSGDLSNLDISQNCIEVRTSGQKLAWKYFLTSFKECYMLKKVNFSGNPLGTPGVEILARIYTRSELGSPDQNAPLRVEEEHSSIVDQSDDPASGNNGRGIRLSIYAKGQSPAYSEVQDAMPQPQGTSEFASESNRRHFRKTRGLRSVPELTVTGIPMSETGVIPLASNLCMQESREFLCFYLPKTKTGTSRPENEKKNPSITWHLNEHLHQQVRQLLYWATDIAQQTPSFYRHSLAVAINKLEAHPGLTAPWKGRSWRCRSDMKFQWVTKNLCKLAIESEVQGCEIWGIALDIAKKLQTVLFNEEVIHAQLSSSGELFQCLGPERDLVDAINLGMFRSRQLLDGQASQEPWRLGMSLDIWSGVMGMALDNGNILTVDQRKNILQYAVDIDRPMPEKALTERLWGFLFDVDCIMHHAS